MASKLEREPERLWQQGKKREKRHAKRGQKKELLFVVVFRSTAHLQRAHRLIAKVQAHRKDHLVRDMLGKARAALRTGQLGRFSSHRHVRLAFF
jgi:hypothetical protein